MQIVLTAPQGACQPSAFCHNDQEDLPLQQRPVKRGFLGFRGRNALLKLIVGLSLGACTLMGVNAPAKAAPVQNDHPSPASSPALDLNMADPLKAITPVEPAIVPYAKLLEQIIVSMPLTKPPVSEGEAETDEIDVKPDEYLEFEEMRVPLWIVDTILRASELTGADPAYMMALADKESSFLPGNKASTSSAVGLFQFISSTWLEAVRSFGPKYGLIMEAEAIEKTAGRLSVPDATKREHILGLRRNPYISALMAAEMMQRDKAKIEKKLGRKLSRSEFYLSHFFGVDSAGKFIALVDDEPKKSAQSAFPAAARSNKSLFFAQDGKKTRQLTVSEVYSKIDGMIDKRLERYEDVSSRSTADASF